MLRARGGAESYVAEYRRKVDDPAVRMLRRYRDIRGASTGTAMICRSGGYRVRLVDSREGVRADDSRGGAFESHDDVSSSGWVDEVPELRVVVVERGDRLCQLGSAERDRRHAVVIRAHPDNEKSVAACTSIEARKCDLVGRLGDRPRRGLDIVHDDAQRGRS